MANALVRRIRRAMGIGPPDKRTYEKLLAVTNRLAATQDALNSEMKHIRSHVSSLLEHLKDQRSAQLVCEDMASSEPSANRQSKDLEALAFEDALLEQQLAKFGPKYVAKHNTHLFSQTYEDAAIAEIFARIGFKNRTFVEIGVEDGKENTTRLLLALGWTGLWIEGNGAHCDTIRRSFRREIASGQLQVIHSTTEPDNVQSLIDAAKLGEEIDFLSIDVDQHTSHIFRAISTRARCCCIEYNAHFPPTIGYEVPFQKGEVWDGSNWFGASLKAITSIADEKGMALVGCDLHGINAYFVAKHLTRDLFPEPFTPEYHYQPPRYPFVLRGQRGHRRSPIVHSDPWRTALARVPGIEPYEFAVHREEDQYISGSIAQTGSWEPFETKIFCRLSPLFATFVDLGANIGWYSAIAQRMMSKTAKIYSFEPAPNNFSCLQRNCEAANLGPQTTLVNKAVADTVGSLEMYLSEANQGDHRIYASENNRPSVRVPVTTLDAFFGKELPPYFLKCDTQGSEPKILRGGRGVLWPNISHSCLILEFWPYGMSTAGEDTLAFADEVAGLPLEVFVIDHDNECLRRICWMSVKQRVIGGDLRPELQNFLDLLLVPPKSQAFRAIEDLIA